MVIVAVVLVEAVVIVAVVLIEVVVVIVIVIVAVVVVVAAVATICLSNPEYNTSAARRVGTGFYALVLAST